MLRERQYQLAEHLHSAGLKLERAVTVLEQHGEQFDRIESAVVESAKRLDDHSGRLARSDAEIIQLRARIQKKQAYSTTKAVAVIGGGLAMLYDIVSHLVNRTR